MKGRVLGTCIFFLKIVVFFVVGPTFSPGVNLERQSKQVGLLNVLENMSAVCVCYMFACVHTYVCMHSQYM